MNWPTCRALALALSLVAAGQAGAQDAGTARVEKAQAAARANAASARGKDWMQRNSAAAGRQLIPVLNACRPEDSADVPTVFSLFVRLSQQGRVREIVTELDADLGACMTRAARELQLPAPPRDEYWIQLNMAASL